MTLPVDPAGLRARVERALAAFLAHRRAQIHALVSATSPEPPDQPTPPPPDQPTPSPPPDQPTDGTVTRLADAIEAFVLGGGKRLRPAFAYWGYRGAGGPDSDQLVSTVAALELVQASALIHDDVMDDSDTRRGGPAVHRRFAALHRSGHWHGDPDGFGTAAAILVGDLCLAWSDELLHTGGLPPEVLARARPVFDQMRTELTVGQYLDVLNQATGDTTVARALTVARLKSATYTVERPLQLGAALAGAAPEVVAAYTAYGQPLGEAFQLRDDVLGVFGDPARTGKPAGDDLREGKRTYLVAAAFEAADDATRSVLATHLGDPKLDESGVAQLRQLITDTGALARAERRITELTAAALAALSTAPLDPAATDALTALASAATSRTD